MRKFLAGAKLLASAWAAATLFTGASAHAAQPAPWEMTFQPAATDMMRQIAWFEQYTLWFIVPITLFVLALIAYCILKFRASVNSIPSRTSHNTLIE
ncbi:MAG: cytochrome c oxidase subunit II, partial [Mesorhizobium sp.]